MANMRGIFIVLGNRLLYKLIFNYFSVISYYNKLFTGANYHGLFIRSKSFC